MSPVTEDQFMALCKRNSIQQPLFFIAVDLATLKPHPYYDVLNKVLDVHHFEPGVRQHGSDVCPAPLNCPRSED